MRTMWVVLVLLAMPAAASGDGEEARTKVPAGTAPTIDGVLGGGEWKQALRVELAPVGEGWLLADEHALYVGVRVAPGCIPSLGLLLGGKIRILHASASLGTAEYERSGGTWKPTRTFSWRCRDGRTTDADRDRFLEDEGWFATTVGVGTKGEAEFRIERRILAEDQRLSFVACRLGGGPPTACVWPASVRDGSTERDLLFGTCPDLSFDPDTWARLDLGKIGSPEVRFAEGLSAVEAAAKADPVKAYVSLLDLLDEHAGVTEGRERAARLERELEKRPEVAAEAAAHRRLEAVLAWMERNPKKTEQAKKKLREVETLHPGTRAARVAKEKRE